MAYTQGIDIVSYKTFVMVDGPRLEVTVRAAQSGQDFTWTVETADVMDVLATACTAIRAASAPADATAAAVLFQTQLRSALLDKLVVLGKMDGSA